MSTLRDRLADLAQDVRPGAADPDLWGRGRRLARRRCAAVVGAVLTVALLAALSAAGIAGRPLHPVEPAAPEGRTVVPDGIFTRSQRLPTADGPTGPLVAVIPTDHFAWFHRGEPGLVGVSAVNQSYAFLDLPGFLGEDGQGGTWSLSTDGRRLAYWYGDRSDRPGEPVARGIAVLDTTSGELRRHALGGDLGVTPHRVGWAGDTLFFGEWDVTEVRDDGTASTVGASYAWPPGEDDPHELDDPRQLAGGPAGPAGSDGFVVPSAGRHWYVVRSEADLSAPPIARLAQGEPQPQRAALSPDGTTLAWIHEGSTRGRLTTAPVGDEQPTSRPRGDLGRYPELIGWLDDERVMVVSTRAGNRELLAADVRTGEVRVLSTLDTQSDDGTQLAVGLLGSPVVAAVVPPDPRDPRLVAIAVGLAVLVLLMVSVPGLVLWRRRAR